MGVLIEQRTEDRGQRTEDGIMQISSAKDLIVYQKAYSLAMDIFHLTKRFPSEERFALTSQIRRSSRSVCLNLREAWAKRRYEPHFISKLTDCDAESNETDTALDFAKDCGFITAEDHVRLVGICSEVRRIIGAMLANPAPFMLKET
jgi:four helix bundle protein